jgi:hypothetical protein
MSISSDQNGMKVLAFRDGRIWKVSPNNILYYAPAEVLAWTAGELGERTPPVSTEAAMAILKRGFDVGSVESPEWFEEHLPEYIVGGVYFFNDKWGDIEACVVIRDKLVTNSPDTIREILAYPFNQLKKNRVTFLVRVEHEKVIKAAEGLGAELECIREGAGPLGDDIAQYYLKPNMISELVMREAA